MRFLVGALVLGALALLPATSLAAGDPLRSQQWGLDMVESDAAHQTARGTGAIVAVVDSGVNAGHPDLAGRLLPGHDFVDGDSTPQDGDGHGTHVTGIVAADDGNGVGVSSVAPGARVLPVRVLGDDGSGDAARVAAGIDYAVAHGAQVLNLSLGPDVPLVGPESDFGAAIDRALDRGVIVVAAAGNDGLPACEQPSGQGRLLCVGSVDKRGMRSFFSSFGQGLGVVAPGGSAVPVSGEDILSTWKDGGYMELAGTSQAAPHVAGVAALLVSKGLRGQAAVDRILATAKDAGTPGPDPQYGAGIVNARAAVAGLKGGAGGGGASAARVSIPRVQRLRDVLRHGVKVRCRAAGSGRCRAKAKRRKRVLAYGTHRVKAGVPVTTYARPNRRGRSLERRALRRRKSFHVWIRVTLPGAAPVRRLVRLKP